MNVQMKQRFKYMGCWFVWNFACQIAVGLRIDRISILYNSAPPDVFFAPKCDVRKSQCRWTMTYGRNFVEHKNLTCHFSDITPSFKTRFIKREVTRKATYLTDNKILCPAPYPTDLKYGLRSKSSSNLIGMWRYQLAVSNDGIRKSRSVEAIVGVVTASECERCSSVTGICQKKRDRCLINGRCYFPGIRNPNDPCLQCNPYGDEFDWSIRQACFQTTTASTTIRVPETNDTTEETTVLHLDLVTSSTLLEHGLVTLESMTTSKPTTVTTVNVTSPTCKSTMSSQEATMIQNVPLTTQSGNRSQVTQDIRRSSSSKLSAVIAQTTTVPDKKYTKVRLPVTPPLMKDTQNSATNTEVIGIGVGSLFFVVLIFVAVFIVCVIVGRKNRVENSC